MRESPFGKTKLPCAVLGATGAVGQAFVRLLADHPWFELTEVAVHRIDPFDNDEAALRFVACQSGIE